MTDFFQLSPYARFINSEIRCVEISIGIDLMIVVLYYFDLIILV